MAVDWDYYDKFEDILDEYLPTTGEGDTMANQIVTAVNKLVYKWYNDEDVFDNTGALHAGWNDLSPYANWLANYTGVNHILFRVYKCTDGSDYEDLLKRLADRCFDENFLSKYAQEEKTGSIYDCDGPYRIEEEDDEEW